VDEPTAQRVLSALDQLSAPLNDLTELSTTFQNNEEQVAFRSILADQLVVPCAELYQFVYRQYPNLDPTRK
jgi:hypothetical protein